MNAQPRKSGPSNHSRRASNIVNMARDMYNAIYSPLMKLAQSDIRDDKNQTVIPEENRKLIESEVQQSKSADITSTEPITALESSNFDPQPLLLAADKPLHRESEVQQSKSFDITSTEPMPSLREAPPTATSRTNIALESSKFDTQPLPQWQQFGSKFSAFLEQMPKYLGKFSTEYQLPIICFATIIAATVAVKLIIAVLDVLNEIPQLNLVFELTGIGYITWFFSDIFSKLLLGKN